MKVFLSLLQILPKVAVISLAGYGIYLFVAMQIARDDTPLADANIFIAFLGIAAIAFAVYLAVLILYGICCLFDLTVIIILILIYQRVDTSRIAAERKIKIISLLNVLKKTSTIRHWYENTLRDMEIAE